MGGGPTETIVSLADHRTFPVARFARVDGMRSRTRTSLPPGASRTATPAHATIDRTHPDHRRTSVVIVEPAPTANSHGIRIRPAGMRAKFTHCEAGQHRYARNDIQVAGTRAQTRAGRSSAGTVEPPARRSRSAPTVSVAARFRFVSAERHVVHAGHATPRKNAPAPPHEHGRGRNVGHGSRSVADRRRYPPTANERTERPPTEPSWENRTTRPRVRRPPITTDGGSGVAVAEPAVSAGLRDEGGGAHCSPMAPRPRRASTRPRAR